MKVTVFTPTYNRAHILQRAFDSLLRQTSKNFEWLLIDDGSSDHTKELASKFQQQADFPVRYYYKENGGKHTAYNLAVEKAQGEWFVCLDSDDEMTEDAVAQIISQMETNPAAQGLVAYKANKQGQYMADLLPLDVTFLQLWELGAKYGCRGDYVFAYATASAKTCLFPVFQNERFSPESIVLDRLACVVTVVRKALMICEYLSDGYTSNYTSLMKKNPCGFSVFFAQRVDMPISFFERCVSAGKYWYFRKMSKNEAPRYMGKHKLLVALAVVLGCFFGVYYKVIRKI